MKTQEVILSRINGRRPSGKIVPHSLSICRSELTHIILQNGLKVLDLFRDWLLLDRSPLLVSLDQEGLVPRSHCLINLSRCPASSKLQLHVLVDPSIVGVALDELYFRLVYLGVPRVKLINVLMGSSIRLEDAVLIKQLTLLLQDLSRIVPGEIIFVLLLECEALATNLLPER